MFALLVLVVLVLLPIAPIALLSLVAPSAERTAAHAAYHALLAQRTDEVVRENENAWRATVQDRERSALAPERVAFPPLPADYLGPIETFDLLGDDIPGHVVTAQRAAVAPDPSDPFVWRTVAGERRAAAAAVARHCAALRRAGVTQERAVTIARCTRAAVGDGRYPAEVARIVAGM